MREESSRGLTTCGARAVAEPCVVLLHSGRFLPPDVLAFLEGLVPPGICWRPLEQGSSPSVRRAAFADANYVFAYPGDPTPEELESARHLKLFQLLSAGHDWLDLDAFRRNGIPVASNDGSNAVSTAEHAVMLMLALLKQLPRHHGSTAGGGWLGMSTTMQLRELRGKIVGLVGFGHIAQQVGRRVVAFDATLLYTKPRRAALDDEQALGAVYRTLDELLGESDIVSLHLPLTPRTRGMIDARALALMRPGGWLVNTARGALVDEGALIGALSDGHLAGAGLDVFAHEPIDPDSPLLRLRNVVLTPHVAGATRDSWTHRMSLAWENVTRVESGLPPLSRIA